MERRKFTREFKLEAVRLLRIGAYRMYRRRKTWACIHRSFATG
jgi:transposase-like protein